MNNSIKLKADILIEGIQADRECLASLGREHKEQNHGLFGWDFENHAGQLLPDDFRLPDGTVVQFRLNSRSPYKVKIDKDILLLFHREQEICPISWLKRPVFYNKKTSQNEEMIKIGQIGGEDCLFFCYQNYCSHFAQNKQCLFCNLVSTSRTYNSVLRKKAKESIGEVAKAALDEGMVNYVLLTGGCFNSAKETEIVSQILESIKKHTGRDRIPGTILPSPAKGDNIKKYYDTGIQAIGYSMEIWDDKLYQAICPGKSENTSHEEFIKNIERAIAIFGEGNVYGVFVMGLETKETLLEGIRILSGLGANIVPFIWSPNPGSKLEGHRAPSADWFYDVTMEAAEIVSENKVPSGVENHCYKCDGNSLLHDALRLKGID